MSDAVVPLELWEGAKENIKPLKEGRKAASLARRFGDDTGASAQAAKVKAERETHEAAILAQAEDPLAAWCSYLLWQMETFTAGGKEELINLLERCTSSLLKTHMEKYKDDIRFLKAENCKDATDVYSVIERAQIGSNHGLLYEHWAAWLEDRRNYDAAVETLQLGVYRGVEIEHLAKLKAAVLIRKAEYERERRAQLEDQALLAGEEPGRTALGGIPASGVRAAAVATSASAPRPKKPVPLTAANNAALKLYIPTDSELASAGAAPASAPIIPAKVLPTTEKERHKENTMVPARWTEVSLATAAPPKRNTAASASSAAPAGAFAVFCDNPDNAPKKKAKKPAAAPPTSSRML